MIASRFSRPLSASDVDSVQGKHGLGCIQPARQSPPLGVCIARPAPLLLQPSAANISHMVFSMVGCGQGFASCWLQHAGFCSWLWGLSMHWYGCSVWRVDVYRRCLFLIVAYVSQQVLESKYAPFWFPVVRLWRGPGGSGIGCIRECRLGPVWLHCDHLICLPLSKYAVRSTSYMRCLPMPSHPCCSILMVTSLQLRIVSHADL